MRLFVLVTAVVAPLAAMAQEAAPASATPASSPYASMLPMLLIFVVFYFLLIRPQQKKFKEHTAMLGALKKGDKVVTAGGIVGVITQADKDGITSVEIAPGITVQVTKQSISALVDAKAPAATTSGKKKNDGIVKNDNVVLKKDQIANDN